MNEYFQFDRRFRRDPFQLFHRDLTFQNHAFCAHSGNRFDRFGVVQSHLRGGVDRESGKIIADHPQSAEVLHDDRIGTQGVQFGKRLSRIREFGFPDERVERDVDFASCLVRVCDEAGHVVIGKIVAPFTGVEFFHAAVDCVRAGVERRQSDGQRSRRGKKFNRMCHAGYLLFAKKENGCLP